MRRFMSLSVMISVVCIVGCASWGHGSRVARPDRRAADEPGTRAFKPYLNGRWIGNGISYGPYRDGQAPGRPPGPTRAQIRQDMHILVQHWNLFRMYGARAAAPVLEVIAEEGLPLRVMVGAWIDVEVRYDEQGAVIEEFPGHVAANRAEVAAAIRLANEYPDIVIAVSVGNETQVTWSSHRVPTELLIGYVRQVRAAVDVPVTVADDFTYWDKSASKVLADEVDFIVMHVYPMWCGQPLDNAMPFTRAQYDAVTAMHPQHTVVIGEAGWATQKHDQGEQARLIIGKAGEAEQERYYEAFTAWTTQERIANFYFEAFDEKWKGGEHPNEVEKHWGLFFSDRTPKQAMQP